jgi:hypothetical protein
MLHVPRPPKVDSNLIKYFEKKNCWDHLASKDVELQIVSII